MNPTKRGKDHTQGLLSSIYYKRKQRKITGEGGACGKYRNQHSHRHRRHHQPLLLPPLPRGRKCRPRSPKSDHTTKIPYFMGVTKDTWLYQIALLRYLKESAGGDYDVDEEEREEREEGGGGAERNISRRKKKAEAEEADVGYRK